MSRLFEGVPAHGLALLALFAAALIAAPYLVSNYILSVLIIVLYFAYVGQAWNLMIGFAGLLSLGHALFVGIGAYASAALFIKFGIPPLIGVFVSITLAMVMGCFIGYLGFRFSIHGVYFALLTIAFAEFTGIMVDHTRWLGGTEGLFLPVTNRDSVDLINLRGSPVMFYYVILALTGCALVLCRLLLNSKLGYYWQAIREDQQAAEASGIHLFKYKMIAVAISSGLTGIAGVWYAFYYNNLFPESTFGTNRSIELILGAIVGGVGTLFGPIIGAFLLTPLGEMLTGLTEGMRIDGIKQFFWGICVAVIVLFRPQGVWPWIAGVLRLDRKTKGDGA
ncbi:branched-chain amino acid ABC transporter permease [Pseudorhodoplanes sp.]|jgi:branched-chain amino acid transport system permease protein|uniref:branched-chain amino acid ABC transporter permease n=1 Tax=Pseudorhodoplanes sp. TaxID=1934341 RepID=UPI002C04A75D|nr:branched-chain amino acid ABC transporter permease [Pseudorhodoplanes sp.]HWV44340.1 branched-chain amino acid ABC transporter permease [Pseudorhodoplanes sp.]